MEQVTIIMGTVDHDGTPDWVLEVHASNVAAKARVRVLNELCDALFQAYNDFRLADIRGTDQNDASAAERTAMSELQAQDPNFPSTVADHCQAQYFLIWPVDLVRPPGPPQIYRGKRAIRVE